HSTVAQLVVQQDRAKLLWRRLQDGSVSLVIGYDAIKLLQLISLAHRNAQFFDLELTGVIEHVAFDLGFGLVSGKAEIGIDWRWHIVHHVTGWQGDLKAVDILYWSVKFHGELARFFSFENSRSLHP